MSFFTLIVSSSFICFAYNKDHIKEDWYITKLIGIWILCQLYFTINDSYIFPLGILVAGFLVKTTLINKNSKTMSFLVGTFSLLLSFFVSKLV